MRVGQPLWLEQAGRPSRQYPRLSGSLDTSIAIVGGGLTGALVAHALTSAGVSTILLEGALVGRGSTAASSALLFCLHAVALWVWRQSGPWRLSARRPAARTGRYDRAAAGERGQ